MKKAKDVKWLIVNGVPPFVPIPSTLTVRVTADEVGETLSIADDNAGIILVIPVEQVNDIIKVVKE